MRIERTPRRGLTLVELMVAAALSLVIMTVLATAFQTGMDTLSQLKSVGDLQERLRVASEKLKEDLKAPHFNDPAVVGDKLSNVRYDQPTFTDPNSGVFRIVQAGATFQEAGVTTDPRFYSTVASPAGKTGYTTAGFNLPNRNVATGGNAHAMQFSVKLDGKTRQKVFTAVRPGTAPGKALDNKFDNLVQNPAATYATRWAIVNYFLTDSGTRNGSGPLFNLHRRIQLLAEEPGAELTAVNPNFSTRIVLDAANVPHIIVNTVDDLKTLANRPAAFIPLGDGSDIVLSNVVSFEVKANWDSNVYRKLTPTPAAPVVAGTGDVPNADYPFDDLPPLMPNTAAPYPPNTSSQSESIPRIFDTAASVNRSPEPAVIGPTTPATEPFHSKVRINAIQVKIRIWDPNNKTARQVTLVQDM